MAAPMKLGCRQERIKSGGTTSDGPPQGYYEVAHTYTLDKFPYDNEDLEIILQSNLINNESLVLNMVNTIDADIANVTASSNIESVNS
eukprot:CAMPEP_0116893534 /NCGR_PEP_ID=MMETSP0467-20121206/3493_1 /TAXON_ID=283647 /ORGANISM="Mesodinium pulex, Strain SPMC105" /LENGTH=87 /DNA_ID=CAMNT_0004563231 /DNA_START=1403 /DNA_END=1668 /DNA_ORIENTATION=+